MRIVLITDRTLMGADPAAAIAAAVRDLPPRAAVIQIREKDLPTRALLAFTRAAIAAAPDQLVVVNDRLDIALAAGAAGVHLPEDGLDVPAALAAAPPGFLIGCSRHSAATAVAAALDGAHLIQLGPIFATPSKSAYGPPLGLASLTAARAALPASTTLVAVGGIDTPDRATAARAAGATAIAVIRAVWSAVDPATTTARLCM